MRKATKEEIKFINECRNNVKSANFALLYGSGPKTLAESLMKSNSELTEIEALELAKKLIRFKKGIKVDGRLVNGIDSKVYNAFYDYTHRRKTQLPGLGTIISAPCEFDVTGDDFKTSRENFLIQASGAEFLSAIIVILTYLADKYGVEYYYCISIHDEMSFIVNENQVLEFAAIMQMAHFYTWNLFYEQFGVTEFPWQKAFFDSIEVGHCLRKEANEDLTTPSNPNGGSEPPGYTITAKELYDKGIFKAMNLR
jgi:DNA polymerase gamma 1